jgi:homoserine O-acetyltransferase/O-succinyltransferase
MARTMRGVGIAAAVAAIGWSGSAAAEVHEIEGFTFESGASLEVMRVGYDTHGTLNEARDNAVLITHGTSGDRHGYDDYIGPGRAFDTDRFFVVTVDAIGGGDSSKPSDGLGTDFPSYNMRDMVHAQHHLLREGLGVERLAAVAGPSMGGFLALEWGIQYPEDVDSLVVIAGAPYSDRLYSGVIDTMVAAMQLDPAWQDDDPATNATAGLEVAGMVFTPWLYSDEIMNRLDEDEFAWLFHSMGRGWAESWQDVDWMYRYRAARSHDVAAPFDGDLDAALATVEARTLIVHMSSERLFPDRHARLMDEGIADSRLAVLETDRGHMGCCQPEGIAEHRELSALIAEFLDEQEVAGN